MRTLGALGLLLSTVLVVATVTLPDAASAARLTSRAPTEAENAAIVRAFDRSARHRAEGILEIRITRSGPRVASVLAIPLRAHRRQARSSFAARAADPGRDDSARVARPLDPDYFLERPTGEWKADHNVSSALARRLRSIVAVWFVEFKGSGTDTLVASSPGETAQNEQLRPATDTGEGRNELRFHHRVVAGARHGRAWLAGKGQGQRNRHDHAAGRRVARASSASSPTT